MDAGRQLVFTLRGAPGASSTGVEARLRSRLEGGLVVELPAPDAAVRERVLARELEAKLGAADPELAAYLASRPADSIRATSGAAAARARRRPTARGRAAGARRSRARCWRSRRPAPPAPRRPARSLERGASARAPGATRSREKMVWEWPEVGDRVIEEWR